MINLIITFINGTILGATIYLYINIFTKKREIMSNYIHLSALFNKAVPAMDWLHKVDIDIKTLQDKVACLWRQSRDNAVNAFTQQDIDRIIQQTKSVERKKRPNKIRIDDSCY